MTGNVWSCEKYFLVGLIGALFICTTLGSPLPQEDDGSYETDLVTSLFDAVTEQLTEETPNSISTTTEFKTSSISTTTELITSSISSTTELTLSSSSTSTELTTSTTTTEHPDNERAKWFTQPTSVMHNMQYASGVHSYSVGPGEDKDERALEEYRNTFERREQNLPPPTPRNHFAPQRKH